mmetsp:Transcript_24287/g.44587  ORF Transcript_24287/g.44587 Transcript_24287/m.44587 type:complete len:185 (+) Transcript_24287:126-680(+)
MGKKRRTAEDEVAGPADKSTKRQKGTTPSILPLAELEERESALAEELRAARRSLGTVRGTDPGQNRITWQREVTKHNNAVHKLELTYNEVRRELEKRKAAGEGKGLAAATPVPVLPGQVVLGGAGVVPDGPPVVVPPPPPMVVMPTTWANSANTQAAAVTAPSLLQATLQTQLPLASAAWSLHS